ncbi:hypothetical protein V2I29_08040 [Campylobacter sp. CX2-8023-23]|uniref:HMA2 domain-containing protein n=1 Tax=Campylobacter porcelli TaxID=1660073 RepID=UPI002ECEFDF4|nr:hypothetical protein [Campylobacter sp. CX2-8023-23]
MKQNGQISLSNLQVKPSDLELLSAYFSIIHHSKGRIRLRASLKLKNAAQDSKIDAKELMEKLSKISSIKEIKFNKLIGSLTISYDTNLIEPSLWEDAINGRNLEKIANVINENLKDIK